MNRLDLGGAIVFVLACGTSACGGDGGTETPATGPDAGPAAADASAPGTDGGEAPGAAPVLDRLPVDFASAFLLETTFDSKIQQQGPVVASGDIPVGHGGLPEPSLLLQFLRRDADVVAAFSGTVLDVRDQPETCDAEIFIAPGGSSKSTPIWVAGYDHVKNPKVKRGDAVKSGDVLGTPGSLFYGCDGPGRTELQINHVPTDLAHCPLDFMDPATRAKAEADLRALMTAWNTAVGKEIYDAVHMAAAGCITKTTKP